MEQLQIVVAMILICSTSAQLRRGEGGNCSFTIINDNPGYEPLYLIKDVSTLSFFIPDGQIGSIPVGRTLKVVCPGDRNFVTAPGLNAIDANSTRLTCVNGNRLRTDYGAFVNLISINCSKMLSADVRGTSESCANDQANIYEIGFTAYGQFLKVLQVCFSNVTDTTFYSIHVINGKAVKYNAKNTAYRAFQADGITSDAKAAYSRKNQIERFNKLLGSTQNYITDTENSKSLIRGQLSPHPDFIYESVQIATYFYLNALPQFQTINAGNWLRIENLARDLAINYNTSLLIYTGVFEALNLPNESGELVTLTLSDSNNIPIPKWFWKFIKNEETDSGIVMITLNNPFANLNEINEFCPNVCDKAKISTENFNDITMGYTFCCEVIEFQKVVTFLPPEFNVSSLLNCGIITNRKKRGRS